MQSTIYRLNNGSLVLESHRMKHASSLPSQHLEIHSLETLLEPKSDKLSSLDKLKHFEYFYVLNGSGTIFIDTQEYDLAAGMVYCLSPGQIRQLLPSANLEGYYLSVSSEQYYLSKNRLASSCDTTGFQLANYPLVFRVASEDQAEQEEIIRKMKKEFVTSLNYRQEIMKGLFSLFLLYLSRHYQPEEAAKPRTRDRELLSGFQQLLVRQYADKKMVADYASALSVTPGYLNQVVKKLSGFTARHHIQQQLVMEAKRLLQETGNSMKEIAYRLGFDDTAHFSKFFKNNSGMNFSEYKRMVGAA